MKHIQFKTESLFPFLRKKSRKWKDSAMATVFIKNINSYNEKILTENIFEIMDSILQREIKTGTKVLIKPNLLAPALPQKAVITHPLIIKAVATYAIDQGAKVQISDSPAISSIETVTRIGRIKEALKGLPVEIKEFKDSIPIETEKPFYHIELARDAIETDLIINLPKFKTHGQMLLTLGVKNLFGCVVGIRKPEWHFRVGTDRELFAKLLVTIYKIITPKITILDGILGMEGEGPGKSGIPKHIGVLMASEDAIALDSMACQAIGLDPFELLTLKVANSLGIFPDYVDIKGELPYISDFKLPDISPVVFGPKILHGILRKHLIQRPAASKSLCRLCGECWNYCPVNAIKKIKDKLLIDYDKCIRCYCCIEICPYGAMQKTESLIGKFVRKMVEKTERGKGKMY